LGTVLVLAVSLSLVAQVPGAPPSTNQVGGHFLAPPPSVTSIGGHHLPPPLPSVTSIPNYGFHYRNGQYFNGHYGGHGYRSGGWAYAAPYYYPLDDPGAYGYDYVGGGGAGPDLYSGPPLGPDQNPHIVVEQPPSRRYNNYNSDDAPYARAYAPPPAPPAPAVDAKPGDPTVLVFRDGHQQEVTNYAIMGDSVYVLDKGRKKIALADLDLAATVKANDDRGLEFRLPPSPANNQKNSPLPQSTTPDEHTTAPASIASAMP
jgi:hypothetical protein